jgi:protein-S-isoprenylcysteine O-methyltransferase Ste14
MTTTMTPTIPVTRDTPGIAARPPILFLLAAGGGAALDWLRPLPLLRGAPALRLAAGGVLVAAGFALFAAAARLFRRAGTPLPACAPTTALVIDGPYRWSRNPVYLAFALVQVGLALWANSGWLLLTLAPTLLIVRYGVIAREEAYLARRFGAAYQAYAAGVRRWV